MSLSARCDVILRLLNEVLDVPAADPSMAHATTAEALQRMALSLPLEREQTGVGHEVAPRPN